MRRILHVSRFFYLDSSSGAAIANRMMLEHLALRGFIVEAISGPLVEGATDVLPLEAMLQYDPGGRRVRGGSSDRFLAGIGGLRMQRPPHIIANINGVGLACLDRPLRRNSPMGSDEEGEFLAMVGSTLDRLQPDILVSYGGDPMTLDIIARARWAGIKTVFTLHNFGYPNSAPFSNVDAVVVPSNFSAEYHKQFIGMDCAVLPSLVDPRRVQSSRRVAEYVTFVNASPEKGVYAFARIADELGRRRPDIPLLVVESRGTEETLVACGIDLRPWGNVFLMHQTGDPRDFWSVTGVCLVPSLCWESQGMVAIEAMLNGIPVIASDRGALPETLGSGGLVLPLPAWMTPTSEALPTPEEVAPWVDAVISLWDNPVLQADLCRKALAESRRWDIEIIQLKNVEFFMHLGQRTKI